MVNGIDIFREHFNHFKEQYTVIGGFACDLLMNDAGLDFRQTVDIDMVLIVEALTTDFAKAFWAFIEAGGYQARQRSNGQPEFYRFVDPTNPAYPKMIELFSRPQSNVVLQPDTANAPAPTPCPAAIKRFSRTWVDTPSMEAVWTERIPVSGWSSIWRSNAVVKRAGA